MVEHTPGIRIQHAIGIVVLGCGLGGLILVSVLAIAWSNVAHQATELSNDATAVVDLRRFDDELAEWATKVDLVLSGGQTWFLPDLNRASDRIVILLDRMEWEALIPLKPMLRSYISDELDRLEIAARMYGENRREELDKLVKASDEALVPVIDLLSRINDQIDSDIESHRKEHQQTRATLRNVSWSAMALYLIGIALLWRWASAVITAPIRLLDTATGRSLATGEPISVSTSGPREIRTLTASVTALTGRFEEIVAARTLDIQRSSEIRRVILDTVSLPLVHIDADGLIESYNYACASFFGMSDSDSLVGESADHFPLGIFLDREDGQYSIEDGSGRKRTVHVTTASVPGHAGTIICLFDLTEQVADAAKLRSMLRELDHRVRNTLAAIQSLVDMQMAAEETSSDGLLVLSGRIQAMARAHELLAVTQRTGVDLKDAIEVILRSWAPEDAVTLQGEQVRINPETALPMCLLINELATNSVKHGSLSLSEGRVSIDWSKKAGSIVLNWVETGGPENPSPQRTNGSGLGLIRGFAEHQMHGNCKFDWHADGLRVHLQFKQ